MRLGLKLSYWGAQPDYDGIALAQEAERLGYDIVWISESYSSDAVSVLSYIAAKTTRIGIGSAVMQMPGRSAAMTAMTAATLDALSKGRFHLGLGVSSPHLTTNWHNVPFSAPLERTRRYVERIRAILRREHVTASGTASEDGAGVKLILHPVRDDLPIYLAALGPRNLELTGEIADGWLGVFCSPEHLAPSLNSLRTGGRRDGGVDKAFDIAISVRLAAGPDVQEAANLLRKTAAMYIGGMGAASANFYFDLAARMGYEPEAMIIQERFRAGDVAAAEAAVPFSFLDATSLLGDVERLAERLAAFAAAGVTTLSVAPTAETLDGRIAELRAVSAAFDLAGVR